MKNERRGEGETVGGRGRDVEITRKRRKAKETGNKNVEDAA